MSNENVIEDNDSSPFNLSMTDNNILEVSQKISRKKKKALKDRTATVRAYVFDEKDAESLMKIEVIDLDEIKGRNYFSDILAILKGKHRLFP